MSKYYVELINFIFFLITSARVPVERIGFQKKNLKTTDC